MVTLKKLSFSKVPVRVQHFPGGWGSNFFQGRSNCLFPIETYIICDFPGVVWTPCPPSGSAHEVLLCFDLLSSFLCSNTNGYVTCFFLQHFSSTSDNFIVNKFTFVLLEVFKGIIRKITMQWLYSISIILL